MTSYKMNKDKSKDSGDYEKNNYKEPERKRKERRVNYSSLLKKWKEILKDSITISNNLMMPLRDS